MSPRPTPVVGSRRRAAPEGEEVSAPEAVSTGTRTGRTGGGGRRRPSIRLRHTGSSGAAAVSLEKVVEAPERFRRPLFTGRRLAALIAALVVVAAAVWGFFFSSLLTVRQISVEGNDRQDPAAVRNLLDHEKGQPLARVDLQAAAREVTTLPAVRDAQVTRAWPNGLDVRIVERTPVAVVSSGSGYTLVDANGVKLATTATVPPGLPVMTQATLKAGPAATLAVSQSLDRLPASLLAKVRTAGATTQDSVTFILKSGAVVKWGSSEDAEQKGEILATLLRRTKAHTIDVTAPDLPVTR